MVQSLTRSQQLVLPSLLRKTKAEVRCIRIAFEVGGEMSIAQRNHCDEFPIMIGSFMRTGQETEDWGFI